MDTSTKTILPSSTNTSSTMTSLLDLIESDDPNKLMPLDVTSDTCGPHKIFISAGKGREYSEADDSDFVKQIKSYGVLDEDDLTFKNGWIYRKSGGMGIDTDETRDFDYKWAYVRKRDIITKNTLKNGTRIDFMLLSNNDVTLSPFDYDTYINKNTNDQESDEDNDENWEDNDTDANILLYETFVNNNMKIDGLNLMYADETVLKSSYANILFKYPSFENEVVFTIHSDDRVKGFTMKELALKVFRYYHLQVFLCKNYDMENGKMLTEAPDEKTFNRCFRPVLWESEWTDNGILSLEYCKDTNQWEVLLSDYI